MARILKVVSPFDLFDVFVYSSGPTVLLFPLDKVALLVSILTYALPSCMTMRHPPDSARGHILWGGRLFFPSSLYSWVSLVYFYQILETLT